MHDHEDYLIDIIQQRSYAKRSVIDVDKKVSARPGARWDMHYIDKNLSSIYFFRLCAPGGETAPFGAVLPVYQLHACKTAAMRAACTAARTSPKR